MLSGLFLIEKTMITFEFLLYYRKKSYYQIIRFRVDIMNHIAKSELLLGALLSYADINIDGDVDFHDVVTLCKVHLSNKKARYQYFHDCGT